MLPSVSGKNSPLELELPSSSVEPVRELFLRLRAGDYDPIIGHSSWHPRYDSPPDPLPSLPLFLRPARVQILSLIPTPKRHGSENRSAIRVSRTHPKLCGGPFLAFSREPSFGGPRKVKPQANRSQHAGQAGTFAVPVLLSQPAGTA